MSEYRLQYLDRSRKFIRQDVVRATSDEEAVIMALSRRLSRRSELWKDGRLVAKLDARRNIRAFYSRSDASVYPLQG